MKEIVFVSQSPTSDLTVKWNKDGTVMLTLASSLSTGATAENPKPVAAVELDWPTLAALRHSINVAEEAALAEERERDELHKLAGHIEGQLGSMA